MTVIFFLPVIIRDAHRHIYPLEQLENEGHQVIILDATRYYKVYHPTFTDNFIKDHLEVCKSKSDFINFRNKLGSEPVIFVTNDLYMSMAFEVLNILVRKEDRLLSAITRHAAVHHKYPGFLKKKLSDIVRYFHNFLPLYLFKLYYLNVKKIYTPDYFLGSTEFLTSVKTFLSVQDKNIICVHSDDINYAYKPLNQVIDPNKKIGVFIDQMIPYFNGRNPDVHNKEIQKEYKIDYYKNLVKTLKKLKLEFDLDDIVIALHPEANLIREEIDNKYAPFRTFIGFSHELIKDSSMVFGHYSTAIGMAVFYKKPIILLKDRGFMEHPRRMQFIYSYKRELGVKILSTDSNSIVSREDAVMNMTLYNNYIKKFLKNNAYKGNNYYYAIKKINEDMEKKF